MHTYILHLDVYISVLTDVWFFFNGLYPDIGSSWDCLLLLPLLVISAPTLWLNTSQDLIPTYMLYDLSSLFRPLKYSY